MPFYFWSGVMLVYIGLVTVALEIVLEPWLIQKPIWIPVAGIGVVMAIFDIFSIGVVFGRAPIEAAGFASKALYLPGAVIAGIQWSQRYTEVDLSIFNPSNEDYDDLDLTINSDVPIAAIGENTGLSIQVSDPMLVSLRELLFSGDTGQQMANPLVLIATTAGKRVRSPKLPSHSRLDLVIALAEINKSAKTGGNIFDPLYWIEAGFSNGKKEWFGHTVGGKPPDAVFGAPPTARTIIINGSYRAKLKTYRVDQSVSIAELKLPTHF